MTFIYHITHINNLPLILKSGGLFAKNELIQQEVNHLDIAHEGIQSRRARIPVPCGAGGVLHDYVPFYLAPRSPMLYAIHNGRVADYTQGQNPIIYLVAEAEIIKSEGIPFAFTDGHAVMSYSDFYDDLSALESSIDWAIMKDKYWDKSPEDNDSKRRRQAEFLVYQFCPWRLITKIGVINNTTKLQVEEILAKFNYQIQISVCSNWYY
ncbi:DUF4433 domain-containing protein [Ancylothrix sp. C2]|uniref:type II toxin-antitoxin system toxin DNA ADP-ribosyl transferase DarT n=1 Tax=Ancylothrix sp. D3o TaxID=2953691 RepID=UPI0021BA59BA|nr:DUF4433 domain-containing protein [Ancylothrix sp. D3o]MCT7953302.1 DUF4433 domain-containing protein [Ancylothrix sp. D3o]